jgi:hypothetical protein
MKRQGNGGYGILAQKDHMNVLRVKRVQRTMVDIQRKIVSYGKQLGSLKWINLRLDCVVFVMMEQDV